jgi:hypothetical protein
MSGYLRGLKAPKFAEGMRPYASLKRDLFSVKRKHPPLPSSPSPCHSSFSFRGVLFLINFKRMKFY